MTRYYVKGGTSVDLTDRDFLAQGGEKKIFAKLGTAYCVYHDPKAAIPVGKIRELSALNHPGVVLPTSELLDSSKRHVGEVMRFVDDSYAPEAPDIKPLVLCQLFTNAFRRKNKIETKHVIKITDQILEIVRYCHRGGVVLVDPNETNWLVRHDLAFTYLIDTSCVQTVSYPGTAIKPAIRDWTAKAFTPESDWYSIAVVLGWLWAGIHPFISYHPDWQLKNPNDKDEATKLMIERMKRNVSFFNPQTEFNRACRPLEEIPAGLRAWLKTVLNEGKRVAGPDCCGAPVAVVTTSRTLTPATTDKVELVLIQDYGSDIRGIFGDIVVTDQLPPSAVIVRTPQQDRPIAAAVDRAGRARLWRHDTDEAINLSRSAKRVFVSGGRLYVASSDSVAEVIFNELRDEIRATVKKVGSIADLPTTRCWPGCVIQNLLGKYLLSIFPETGQCVQQQLPELEGWQILDAKYEAGALIVSAEQHGNYRMVMFRINGGRDVTELSIDHSDVNFAVTDRGIAAIMEPGGTLRICSSKPGSQGVRRLTFPEPDMQLYARDSKVVGVLDSRLFAINLK